MEELATELAQAFHDGKTARDKILRILTDPNCKVDDDTKKNIYEPNLAIKLTLTTKLRAHKKRYKVAILIRFKLPENLPEEHLMEIARKLYIKNNMNYIIANDLSNLRQDWNLSSLVNEELSKCRV